MPETPTLDHLLRPVIDDATKRRVRAAFAEVPDGKRGALLVIADVGTGEVRAQAAARYGDHWKVAAGGGGVLRGETRPFGYVAVEFVW